MDFCLLSLGLNKKSHCFSGTFCGAGGGARTPGLMVRSHALYPAELRLRTTWRLREILTLVNRLGILNAVHALVAQLVEQETLNLLVVGSSPTQRTTKNILERECFLFWKIK